MALGPNDGRKLYAPLADINVTPLVDVMLVLLIVFMVTAPMLAAGVKINLPQAARSADNLPQHNPLTITITRDGVIYVDSDAVVAAQLLDAVRSRLGGQLDTPIRLRGDRDANYGDVVAVLDQLAGEGLTKISIVTSSKTAGKPLPPPHD